MSERKIEFETKEIRIDRIRLGERNVRRHEERGLIEKLKQSMSWIGLLHAIVVVPQNDEYELMAGLQRLIAAKELRQKTIEAKVQRSL